MVLKSTYSAVVRALCKSVFLRARIMGAVMTLAGIAFFMADASRMGAAGAGLVLGGLVFALSLPQLVIRQSVRRSAPALAVPWRYEIDHDAIRVATALATTEWRWQAITAAEEHADFWLMRTAIKGHAVIVVKRAFSPADQVALEQLVMQRGLATGADSKVAT